MDTNNIIIENTDDRTPPTPGSGLIASRKNRVVASLGNNSEMVSIIVQAYNRLDKNKNCIESILKYSEGIDFELILIDNGSSDGTFEYFQSINYPKKKIIRVTKNIGSTVPIILNHTSGRYLAFITNDTYVTKNWLSNLLTCLRSDDEIGMVVPVVSNGSNLQGADITFSSLEEMQEKAALHNVSNPSLWHERIRLVFQAVIYKKEVLDIIGFGDYGFFHDFADDDLSFRVRRAGYKTVLCKDTFVHHDHVRKNLSPTEIDDFNKSIKSGSEDFQNKFYGIDAWIDVNNYELNMMALVNSQEQAANNNIEVLGIDVACGTPILELKNKLKEAQKFDTKLSAFSTDPKYWLDLKTICKGDVSVDNINNIANHYHDESFDYILFGKPINSYQSITSLINNVSRLIKKDGHILLKLANSYDAITFLKTLGVTINFNSETSHLDMNYQITIEELIGHFANAGFVNKKIIIENWPLDANFLNKIRKLITDAGMSNNVDELFIRASARNFVIDFAKR